MSRQIHFLDTRIVYIETSLLAGTRANRRNALLCPLALIRMGQLGNEHGRARTPRIADHYRIMYKEVMHLTTPIRLGCVVICFAACVELLESSDDWGKSDKDCIVFGNHPKQADVTVPQANVPDKGSIYVFG